MISVRRLIIESNQHSLTQAQTRPWEYFRHCNGKVTVVQWTQIWQQNLNLFFWHWILPCASWQGWWHIMQSRFWRSFQMTDSSANWQLARVVFSLARRVWMVTSKVDITIRGIKSQPCQSLLHPFSLSLPLYFTTDNRTNDLYFSGHSMCYIGVGLLQ